VKTVEYGQIIGIGSFGNPDSAVVGVYLTADGDPFVY
jgi:hypothetical protein